jgi:hypothetical protein
MHLVGPSGDHGKDRFSINRCATLAGDDPDDKIPNVNSIILTNDGGLSNAPTIDVGAVGAVEVRHDEAALSK